jgi:predicted acetylornithine/succinylornithine family transaminase
MGKEHSVHNASAVNPPLPRQYGDELLVMERGEGVRLYDAAGREYLDFAGGIAVNSLGYGREDLARTAYEQMKRLAHVSNLFTTGPTLALARAMTASGPFAAAFFGNSGAEANEAALKYARLYALRTRGPGHEKLLCFTNAFHGRTMGALSCTPSAKYQEPFAPLIPGVLTAPYNDTAALERTLDGSVAGVIVEVIQGEGGLTAMTPEFAAALNRLCRKHDVILIADEVQTGLSRTGSLYASSAVGLEPDIITLAKPLAGGLPLSAALIPAKVNDQIHPGEHGTTFGGGPVTTAVALKVWEIVSRPDFIASVRAKGETLTAALAGLKARSRRIGELRGRGLLQGFTFVTTGSDAQEEMKGLLGRMQKRGLLALRSGTNVIRLAPPLVIEDEDIQAGVHIIEEALE